MSNKIEVKAGIVAWCTCGQSKQFPRCDGSHLTTDKKPFVENFEKDTEKYICTCGKTTKTPFCDGSHASIKE